MKGDSQQFRITNNTHEKMSSKNKDLGARLDNDLKSCYYEI